MTELAVQTTHLRKEYGAKVAVADLTLAVPRGEVFGFLGPNGAGKSTCIKMLLGLVRPTSGSALVLGRPPGDIPTLARVGFLPEHFRFHEWLTGGELLALHGRLNRMDVGAVRKRSADVLELVGLSDAANRSISGYSKGMLQRLGLAQALLHTPALIFLDEPTSALDPLGRRMVRGIIQQVKAQGATVFLNSHLLSEVEVTCDRVAFIKEGVVLRSLSLRELSDEAMRVELRVDAVTPELLARLRPLAQDWRFLDADEGAGEGTLGSLGAESTHVSREQDQPVALELETCSDNIPRIAQAAIDAGARVYALAPRRTSLEQLFLDVVGEEDSGQ